MHKLLLLILYLLIPVHLLAEPLTAEQIRARLLHKTAVWNINNTTQYQFFDSSGLTIFQDAQGNHETGVWTVTDDGMFCSNWQKQGWICYRLRMERNNQVIWEGPVNSFYTPTTEDYTVSRLQSGNKTTFNLPMKAYRPKIFSLGAEIITQEYIPGGNPVPGTGE